MIFWHQFSSKIIYWPGFSPKKKHFDPKLSQNHVLNPKLLQNYILAPSITKFPFQFLWTSEVSSWLINFNADRSKWDNILFGIRMFIHIPIKLTPPPLALMFWFIMFVHENEKMKNKVVERWHLSFLFLLFFVTYIHMLVM